MSLVTEVQARFSSQILINITNPQNTAATTVDSTRLANAATDVEADFQIEAGIEFDDTVSTHVNVAVDGVYAKLLIRSGQFGDAHKFHDEYLARLRALKLITGRDRIMPTTDSLLTATDDTLGDRPVSDRTKFRGYTPGNQSEPVTQID